MNVNVSQTDQQELLGLLPAKLAQHLFEKLRSERARGFGDELRQQGLLDAVLPAVGSDPNLAASALGAWLDALDRWQYEEGNLTPILCFASRVWGLLKSPSSPSSAKWNRASLRTLVLEAFPSLSGPNAPIDLICAVIQSQVPLGALDRTAWFSWPAAMRQESLRLLKWRELQGEVPFGEAAVRYAALRGSIAGAEPDPAASPASEKVESLGGWPFAHEILAGARADTTAPEFVVLGSGVRRIGESAETASACLTLCLRLLGHSVEALDFAAELPIPNTGISLKDWMRLCRRVKLRTEVRPLAGLQASDYPVLCRLRDGSCLLLLDAGPQWCRAYVPGLRFPFRWIRRELLSPEQVEFACAVAGDLRPGAALPPPWRRLRLMGLSRMAYRGEFSDPQFRRTIHLEAAAWPFTSFEPPRLTEPSLDAVMAGHRSLGAEGSPFHGSFRQINLNGTAEMLAWQQIPEAMRELFDNVEAMPVERGAAGLAPRLAALFMDFLSIHPFLNGNRRTAMAFATALCERQGFSLDWASMSRIEIYYAVRCAASGHPRPLIEALRRRLQRNVADEMRDPQADPDPTHLFISAYTQYGKPH